MASPATLLNDVFLKRQMQRQAREVRSHSDIELSSKQSGSGTRSPAPEIRTADCGAARSPGTCGVGTSVAQTTYNIANNIIGQSMLSLPAGLAAGTGLISGTAMSVVICVLFGYTVSLMGRVCHATGGTTHKECGELSSGPRFGMAMALTQTLKGGCDCLGCAIVIGDTFSRILMSLGCPEMLASRQAALLGSVMLVLAPLCLQKDLSMLAYASLGGMLFEAAAVGFMQIRLLDGSYAPGGRFHDEIAERYQPDFDESGVKFWEVSVRSLILLGALSRAYVPHSNAPKFFNEMRTRTVSAFNLSLTMASIFSLVLYTWITFTGYMTFGTNCDGLILNNYAQSDVGAAFARLAIGAAVVCCFPLNFIAFRDSLISVVNFDVESDMIFNALTLSLLAMITLAGCCASSLRFFNSFVGALFGGLIVLMYPGFMVIGAHARTEGGRGEFSKLEVCGAWVLVILGAALSIFVSAIVVIDEYAPELFSTEG